MQPEFIACHEVTRQTMWLNNFIASLKIIDHFTKPLKLYCDNKATIFFIKNNKSSGASKHIDLKYHVVIQRDQDRTTNVEHKRTNAMLADPLTKGIPSYLFKQHLLDKGLVDSL
jgi:hypothetical protein